MATEYIYLRGTCKWAMLRKPDEKYQNFKINLYLDNPSKEVFKKSGLRLEAKADEDGTFFTFRRPVSKLIKGEAVDFGPPQILNADNSEFPADKLVGNGSEVTVKVSVYDTVKGKGHRLEVVRVDSLVEFVPENPGPGGFIAPVAAASSKPSEQPKVPF